MAQRTEAAAQNTKRKLQQMGDKIQQAITLVENQYVDDTDYAALDEGVNSWDNNIENWTRRAQNKIRDRG